MHFVDSLFLVIGQESISILLVHCLPSQSVLFADYTTQNEIENALKRMANGKNSSRKSDNTTGY